MKKNLILVLSVFLAIPGFSDKRIDDLVECSALYTFFSLAGPIMSTKTRLLYDAADFWIEAEITNSEQNNFELYSIINGKNFRISRKQWNELKNSRMRISFSNFYLLRS